MELGEGFERRLGFNSFISSIVLYIPNFGNIQCTGDARADKKSSLDSAALALLYELQRRGKLVIGGSWPVFLYYEVISFKEKGKEVNLFKSRHPKIIFHYVHVDFW